MSVEENDEQCCIIIIILIDCIYEKVHVTSPSVGSSIIRSFKPNLWKSSAQSQSWLFNSIM